MGNKENKGTVLITGASSGIGAVYADRLARRGYDLILVARNGDRLRSLASRLSDATGSAVETVVADLLDAGDLARVETILRTDSSITMLVNNAGTGSAAPLLVSAIGHDERHDHAERHRIDPADLCRCSRLRGAWRGARSSTSPRSSPSCQRRSNGVYGGSKAFVLALSPVAAP